MDLSFSKNDHFSPPLDSLRSWVLSARSEVLALLYGRSGSFHTVEKKFWVLTCTSGLQWWSLVDLYWTSLSQKSTTSLLLSIPYVVGFSVRALRCLLYYTVEAVSSTQWRKLLSSDLHTWPPMVVFNWPLLDLYFSKNNHSSPPLDSLCSWVLSGRSEVVALLYSRSGSFQTVEKNYWVLTCTHGLQWWSLVDLYWTSLSQKMTTSLLLSIPYVVRFSVRALRCLLYYNVEAVSSTQWRKIIEFWLPYVESNVGFV